MKLLIRFFTAAVLYLLMSTAVHAQDQMSDRFPGLPYYSYGSGIGWTTPDSTYQLNMRFRMQNRATYSNYDGQDESVEMLVRRLRLRFDGFVGDPRFLYAIQLSFAPGDVGTLRDGGNINIIRDAVVYYRPNRNWNIGFGQTKLPGNRQRVNSSGALQLTDRSINNALFNIDRDFGLQVYYLNEDTGSFSYNLKTAVSTGEGRNWTDQSDTNLAYTARLEVMPLGSFQRSGIFFEGDIVREETPKLLIGGTWHYNHQAMRTQGQQGAMLAQPADLTSILLDAMLKYRGWSFQTAWMTRQTDFDTVVPGSPFVMAGNGTDLQLSYLFPSDYEIIGRFSTQTPAPEIEAFMPQREQYTFGITRYIWEHALKIQTELTYDARSFPGTGSENGWYLRFQVELGI
jgi:phosphate-selective porin OprO and OprP